VLQTERLVRGAARTGFVYDERCLAHDNGSMILDPKAQWIPVIHVERPERMLLTQRVLAGAGVLEHLHPIPARAATDQELALVHSAEHVAQIREACGRGTQVWVGPEARVSPDSWEPALIAVGGALNAVDAVMSGEVENAYVVLRPPGHHSSSDLSMGFCIFNSVAIACRHAQHAYGAERVAIIDWDVHHGNGTQSVFYGDASVLFISLHQDDLYPKGSGTLEQTGEGSGHRSTVNVPLPAGSGDAVYLDAFERVVEPALAAFKPELLFVSAGQDPAASDPLGRMSVTTEGFRALTARSVSAAQQHCSGRLVVNQEGGYSLDHLPFCNLAIVEALAGLPPSFDADPMELDVPLEAKDGERAAVDRCVEWHLTSTSQ
jgi:acetoin utilization deacetylase AcuC-like enzyme